MDECIYVYRVLKHQKELLENWMEEEQARSTCSSSVVGSVQDELVQVFFQFVYFKRNILQIFYSA